MVRRYISVVSTRSFIAPSKPSVSAESTGASRLNSGRNIGRVDDNVMPAAIAAAGITLVELL